MTKMNSGNAKSFAATPWVPKTKVAPRVTKFPVTCAVNRPCNARKPAVSTKPALKLKMSGRTERGEAVITTVTIFIPLLGTILMLLLPENPRLVRYGALGVAAVPLLLATYIYFAYGGNLGAAALSQETTWIESLNVGYRVGLNGLGFGMFFLAALLTLTAVVAAWDVGRRHFGTHDVPSTLLGVTVLGYPDQLVEVEAVAALR